MKVALLGNTCNNNFAFMRYLIDLGIETHLFLYSNEGKDDSNPIHSPYWDSFFSDQLKNHISYLDIPNGLISVIGRPDKFKLPLNLESFSKAISGFDICVGSGLAPALFKRIKKKLDIFYPYSIGIEWVGELENLKKLSTINLELPFRKILLHYQVEGIRNSIKVINWMPGNSENVLNRLSIPFELMHVPVYYPEDIKLFPENALKKINPSIIKKITDKNTFKIFSFMRHFWDFNSNNYDHETWATANKNNNLLIIGFKKFLNQFPNANAKLFLSEWGEDLNKSRKLVSDLSIEENVEWLPLMPRSNISYILSKYAQLAVGEFIISPNEMWGNTSWECIALGVPFMQSVNFSNSFFKDKFGFPLPPNILDVKSIEDVSNHIKNCYSKFTFSNLRDEENISWFKKYNSHALAKRWITLFEKVIEKKSNLY